ncbi:MAG: rod-binding protein [Candidatus Hydrogenedentota bacterium]|nr:MAG: rod-binding protein [Candidatus Hydrogenedentota bacterium]
MNHTDFASVSARYAGVGETELRLQHLRSPQADSDPRRLRAASQELEAYFLHVLIREMRKTIPPNPILNGGKTEEIFQDFLDEEIARELARSNQLGLADLIYKSLEPLLKEKHNNADTERENDYAQSCQ